MHTRKKLYNVVKNQLLISFITVEIFFFYFVYAEFRKLVSCNCAPKATIIDFLFCNTYEPLAA